MVCSLTIAGREIDLAVKSAGFYTQEPLVLLKTLVTSLVLCLISDKIIILNYISKSLKEIKLTTKNINNIVHHHY